MQKLKYNFVIFFAREDYCKAILGKEVYDSEYVHVYKETFNGNKILRKLFHFHWSYRINSIVQLPFKRLWFKRMYNQKFKNELPVCFLYWDGNNIRFDSGFTKYVRKKNPKNKQVILHMDLISKKIDYPYKVLKDKVDLTITYDANEAIQYGISYFKNDTYSKLIPEPDRLEIHQDIYFLGNVKDRMKIILDVYQKLYSQGIKCKFLLAGVPEEQQKKYEGIEYITNISYEENLKNVIHSKCILEIIQQGSSDLTMRACEAIAYGRRFLTNCQLCEKKNFHKDQLQIFDDINKIDVEFITKNLELREYPALLDMDPMRRLYFIQDELEVINE